MKKLIRFELNGIAQEVAVSPRRLLVELLREDLRLTGTKIGCGEGDCGACTVLVDGKAINSCLMLAIQADGHKITTIEGLAESEQLHPIQQAFVEHGAIQCGFCSPGMILSAKAILDENAKPSESEVRKALVGNLCRCTGYQKIVDAVLAAAETMRKQKTPLEKKS